jgi:peptidoglycan hydrolase-like protein with peptidoglycan-binding domain
LLFYAALFLIFRRRLPLAWLLFFAVLVEAGWEVLENSKSIIERYRATTFSLDYFGDSIANSFGDILSCAAGFLIAHKLDFWHSLFLFALVEIILILTIHDSLLINIIMLVHPIEAIKRGKPACKKSLDRFHDYKDTYCKQIIVRLRFGNDAELLFALLGKLCSRIAKPKTLKEKTMKRILLFLTVFFLFGVSINAQTDTSNKTSTAQTTEEKPKRQIFRANKEQVAQSQKMLKVNETGKLDDETRTAIKKYQSENGLKATGTLNRATLEKMNVALTDKQKEIPVSPSSFASANTGNSTEAKKRPPIFRASKEQVMQAQKMLKVTESGKLDDVTRDGLKKYQAEKGLKVTGTLNQLTLEKMGIALTDKQKENASKSSQ